MVKLLDKNVTKMKYSLIIIVLLLTNCVLCQEIPDVAYKIIPMVVGRDTIVKERAKKSIAYRIKAGKMTKQDSIKYVIAIKNLTLKVNLKARNTAARSILKKDYGNESQMPKYIPKARLNEVLESIPEDGRHQSFDLHPRIKIFSGKCTDRCHSFSFPIPIQKNQYLIYHEFQFGRTLDRAEFIIYTLGDMGECIIDANIALPPFRDAVH